jgi:hypothetical protein
MSAREKKITLYSCNGIKIEKYTNLQNRQYGIGNGSTSKVIEYKQEDTELLPSNIYRKFSRYRSSYEVKLKSSLGFYYTKPISRSDYITNKISSIEARFKYINVIIDNERYYLEYPISYKDTNIGIEIRPWDILPGYKGIFDHFINNLFTDLNKFFNIIDDNKNHLKVKNFNELKKTTYIDIFGNENGPTVNYNDIKILSHGFDLKESFRKRKETNN